MPPPRPWRSRIGDGLRRLAAAIDPRPSERARARPERAWLGTPSGVRGLGGDGAPELWLSRLRDAGLAPPTSGPDAVRDADPDVDVDVDVDVDMDEDVDARPAWPVPGQQPTAEARAPHVPHVPLGARPEPAPPVPAASLPQWRADAPVARLHLPGPRAARLEPVAEAPHEVHAIALPSDALRPSHEQRPSAFFDTRTPASHPASPARHAERPTARADATAAVDEPVERARPRRDEPPAASEAPPGPPSAAGRRASAEPWGRWGDPAPVAPPRPAVPPRPAAPIVPPPTSHPAPRPARTPAIGAAPMPAPPRIPQHPTAADVAMSPTTAPVPAPSPAAPHPWPELAPRIPGADPAATRADIARELARVGRLDREQSAV